MKKMLAAVIIISAIFASSNIYAVDSDLAKMYTKVYETAKEIKPLMKVSKDILLLSSLWDSCIITMTQLEAYSSILGVFNMIKEQDLNEAAIDYPEKWLNKIKTNNELNIESLKKFSKQAIESTSEIYIEVLSTYYVALNEAIAQDLNKFRVIRKAAVKRKK
ncbi:MAG: hypothetical protein V2A72_00890 [Candidatus Omnitrophota bacterium]